VTTASISGRPGSRTRLRLATMMTPFVTATPNSAMKAAPMGVAWAVRQAHQAASSKQRLRELLGTLRIMESTLYASSVHLVVICQDSCGSLFGWRHRS
jgi:hypothetical protein